jgi:hypothetical protein
MEGTPNASAQAKRNFFVSHRRGATDGRIDSESSIAPKGKSSIDDGGRIRGEYAIPD